MEKVIIIGSGPAAQTAAIYTARANLNPLLFEGFMAAGVAAGGQLTTTTEIENFPGFPDAISGADLMIRMRDQSLRYGTRIQTKTVDAVDLSKRPFKVLCAKETYECESLIIATGATAKRLDLKGDQEYWQKGISACAVCDGALPMFRNQALAVIGGGDSAIEEATFLTKFASQVYLIHRRDQLRASKAMQERVFANKKIEILWDHVPLEATGEKFLTGLKIQNVKTKAEQTLAVKGLFYAVGHVPNTAFLNGQLDCDETGYIKTVAGTTRTSTEGVFACGDVQDKIYRQAVTAAGTGCMAALETERFLEGQ